MPLGAGRPMGKGEMRRAHAPTAGTAQTRKAAPPAQGLSGFSSNPFALEHRSGAKQPEKTAEGDAGKKRAGAPEKDGAVSFSGPERKPDDRLAPKRTTFSGGRHTLGQLDAPPPAPEVSMRYNAGNNATTRVVVNPQDAASPLYRPAAGAGPINSAGVYMQVEVEPNLRVQFGGEYCDIDASHTESGSPGAAVGLEWDF